MLSTWAWIVFNLLIYVTASLENDTTKAFIEITELEYEDTCYETAEAEWSFINSPSNKTLSTWVEKLVTYSELKKIQKDEVGNISKDSISDSSLLYKYDVIEKAGDSLLSEESFKAFVYFAGTADLLRSSILHTEKLTNYTRKDVEHTLSHADNIEEKASIWAEWHQQLNPLVKNFSNSLLFIQEASKANDAEDVEKYWELLAGYEDAYEKIHYEWNRIDSLHKKVIKFALSSLSHKYGISFNETMPAYLLGSLDGSDWTTVSVDITPYPNAVYNVKKNLWIKRLLGKSLYKAASGLGNTLLNQVPQADFWGESKFNQQCPSKLINFCRGGAMRVSTCFEPTISNFLSAHKNVGKILFNQMSVEATPILNTANRYSGLEEGVSELFGILAASPAWLNYNHLMNNSTDDNQRMIVSLMITALNVLPRLAYYMSADMWRINAIKTGITEPADLVSSWWKYREEYEGITSNGTEVPSFLNDDYITKNKPYIPKFIGTVLAFQLYEYLMESTEVRYEKIMDKQVNLYFIKMIQHGAADDWQKVVNKYLEIDDVSVDSLMSFFSPLEEFLDENDEELEFETVTAPEAEIEELEKKVIEEMNAPPTTTTVATTTVARKKVEDRTNSKKAATGKGESDNMPDSGNTLESKPAVHEENPKLEEEQEESEEIEDDRFRDDLFGGYRSKDERTPKIKSSKAVWAVGSVLVATIVICIIAIFGKQRCRKTPKNRRYV